MFISQKHEPTLWSSAPLMQSSDVKAHSSTATFISFNYAERMTSELGFSYMLRYGSDMRGRWWATVPPCLAYSCRLISPSSSFHSLVNYITHLSPGLSSVSGTAGVVPGTQILGILNQNSSWCHRLRQWKREGQILLSSSSLFCRISFI